MGQTLPPSPPAPASESRSLPPSAFVLLGANALPIVGVLAHHWTVFAVILLYWSENVVVGAFNVLKIIAAQPEQRVMWLGKAFLIPFFMFHFGLFTYVHGVFVFALFGGSAYHYPGDVVAAIRANGLTTAFALLVGSHAFSFVHNYLMEGEYEQAALPVLMMLPYGRIIVLHLTVIFGGIAAMALGAPLPALLVLVLLKTGLDFRAHVAERNRFAMAAVGRVSAGA